MNNIKSQVLSRHVHLSGGVPVYQATRVTVREERGAVQEAGNQEEAVDLN